MAASSATPQSCQPCYYQAVDSAKEAGGTPVEAAAAQAGGKAWRPLRDRLLDLSRQSLRRTKRGWLYILPLALLSAAIAYFALYLATDIIPVTTRERLPDFVLPLGYTFCALILLAGSPLGAYYLYNYIAGSRFWKSYNETRRELDETSLPLLAADEAYSSAVLSALREQSRSFIFALPSNKGLEEQLLIAACYRLALRRGDFRLNQPSLALRSGDLNYFNTTPLVNTANIASGICLIVPYCNCIGLLALPLLLHSLLRLADQRGTLAAICDYFSEEPLEEALRRSIIAAPR